MAGIESCAVASLLAGPRVSDTCFNAYRSTGARRRAASGSRSSPQNRFQSPSALCTATFLRPLRRARSSSPTRISRDVFRAGRSKKLPVPIESRAGGWLDEGNRAEEGASVDIEGEKERWKSVKQTVVGLHPASLSNSR